MKIAVVIPTVAGREQYLWRCVRGHLDRHQTDHTVVPIVIPGCWSGGMAWQKGAEEAKKIGADYLHLTNDDIVPGFGWLEPMIESVERGEVPVCVVVTATAPVLDGEQMPLEGNPFSEHTSHFEGIECVHPAGRVGQNDSEYPSLPFCSMEQWERIGPMIPTQYGTDKWFGHRAKAAGFPNVCVGAVFYHYAAFVGRDGAIDGWLGQDRLVFDHNIAYPLYVNGELELDRLHSEAKTNDGREAARRWYLQNVGHTYWEY